MAKLFEPIHCKQKEFSIEKSAGIEANWCGVNARPQFAPFKILLRAGPRDPRTKVKNAQSTQAPLLAPPRPHASSTITKFSSE